MTNTRQNIKNFKQKGITLIALVVTIIVLLILAGISIMMLTGQNGILNQASNAKIDTEQATILELLRLEVSEKMLDTESNITYIEHLKQKGFIKEEVPATGELNKVASINVITKIADNTDEDTTCYVIDVTQLLSNPTTGLGTFDDGDVYYLQQGYLHYKSEEQEILSVGVVFQEKTQPSNVLADREPNGGPIFNYRIIEDDKIEILGFNFDNSGYKVGSNSDISYNGILNIIKLNLETLEIPSQIDGKDVTKVSFTDNIGFATHAINDRTLSVILQGINKIVYPNTIKVIGPTNVIFEDLVEVTLPNELIEIGNNAFYYSLNLGNITLPSSVKIIKGSPFYGCKSLTINVEGKNVKEDFTEADNDWNLKLCESVKSKSYATTNFLGE